MKKIFALLSLVCFQIGFSQVSSSFFNDADQFFKANVTNGRVHYGKIKANPAKLNALVETIASTKVDASNKSEYQAFYINAYNLSVINGIVNKYPVAQPTAIPGFFDAKKVNIAGTKMTLNDIENKMLRKVFPKEARFHFVLVCAGLGCPPIINAAYKPATLEAQLSKQTTLAMDNPKFIRVNGSKVKISQIFEWYKKDFTQFGSIVEYINKYKTEKLPAKAKTSFYTYDWTLNDAK